MSTLLDCHTHITNPHSIGNVFAHLERYGEGRSVVLPIAGGDCTGGGPDNHERHVEITVEACEHHGDRVIPFCHVDPVAR